MVLLATLCVHTFCFNDTYVMVSLKLMKYQILQKISVFYKDFWRRKRNI